MAKLEDWIIAHPLEAGFLMLIGYIVLRDLPRFAPSAVKIIRAWRDHSGNGHANNYRGRSASDEIRVDELTQLDDSPSKIREDLDEHVGDVRTALQDLDDRVSENGNAIQKHTFELERGGRKLSKLDQGQTELAKQLAEHRGETRATLRGIKEGQQEVLRLLRGK